MIKPRPLQAPPPRPRTPADAIGELAPKLREIEPCAEIDFSWSRQAITICDMRVPNALRFGDLYTAPEIDEGADKRPGDFERRVKAFMARA